MHYVTMERRSRDDPYVTADGLRRVFFDAGSWMMSWQIGSETKTRPLSRREAWEEVRERYWPFNSERLKIVLGIDGDAQEGSFTNATLQTTDNDPNLEFSIAVHVEIPKHITEEDELAEYLGGIFGHITALHPGLHVEIQLGPPGEGAGGHEPDPEFVAWGKDEGNAHGKYWVALWGTDGPASPEQIFNTRMTAIARAKELGVEFELEVWECDEHGAKELTA